MKKIAIFASGSGSNAENIASYYKNNNKAQVELILTNNPKAGVIDRAKKLNIPCIVFTKEQFDSSDAIIDIFKSHNIDFIVLAGFLWLFPAKIIRFYPKRIVNIHPALLPKYGGKGMYGEKVHNAVLDNGEKETGITIHYVNKNYDEGDIIFQAICNVDPADTTESLSQKVHELEYKYYPQIIGFLIECL